MERHFEINTTEEFGLRCSVIKLCESETNLSQAKLLYSAEPIPFYYLSYLSTRFEYQNRGFGNQLVQRVNLFLNENQTMGIMENTISKDRNPAYKIYQKNNWVELKNHPNWFGYNQPEKTSESDINNIINKILVEPPELNDLIIDFSNLRT